MPKKRDPRTDLGREIRETRERLRYSQDALGELLSVSGTIISRWETGLYQPPIESLARLADLAGTSDAERDATYTRWVSLAGYREPRAGVTPRSASDADESHHATMEGAMGRAIIDEVRDAEKRLRLVLRLREWVQQWPEGAEETAPALDASPPLQDGQAQLCGSTRPGTPP